jgi:hypothetical protein
MTSLPLSRFVPAQAETLMTVISFPISLALAFWPRDWISSALLTLPAPQIDRSKCRTPGRRSQTLELRGVTKVHTSKT